MTNAELSVRLCFSPRTPRGVFSLRSPEVVILSDERSEESKDLWLLFVLSRHNFSRALVVCHCSSSHPQQLSS